METSFERMVKVARGYGPELVESLMEIVRGEGKVQIVDGVETLVPIREADRISAAKVIAGIILNKEALQVKGEDALDELSPFEKRKLLREALEEVEKSIESFQ